MFGVYGKGTSTRRDHALRDTGTVSPERSVSLHKWRGEGGLSRQLLRQVWGPCRHVAVLGSGPSPVLSCAGGRRCPRVHMHDRFTGLASSPHLSGAFF